MKKIVISLYILITIVLFCTGCSSHENTSNKSRSIVLPVISLKSTGDEINPAFYKNGFDFKYENLPVLTLSEKTDEMQIALSDKWDKTVTIGEDYYKYTSNTGTSYREAYELTKDDNNMVSLSISKRGSVRAEEAIYFLENEEGAFVYKVIFPLDTKN